MFLFIQEVLKSNIFLHGTKLILDIFFRHSLYIKLSIKYSTTLEIPHRTFYDSNILQGANSTPENIH